MANETLITDLVAQEALDQLEALDQKMEGTLKQFRDCALELAKGIKIPVEVNGDLQQLQQLANTTMQRAGQAAQQYTQCLQQQQQVIANTTNTISRRLAEQEKLNKTQREAFTQNQQALDIAERIVGTYEQNSRQIAKYKNELDKNKAALKEVDKERKNGLITEEQAIQRSAALMAEQQKLKAAMQEVSAIHRIQAKEANAAEGSYRQLSQQLELLKKAQKGLNESEKAGEEGRLLEAEIQNLDARLKDLAADMGEFQRNVGNYAIANGSLKQSYNELTEMLTALKLQYNEMDEAQQQSAEGEQLSARIDQLTAKIGIYKATMDEVNASVANSAAGQQITKLTFELTALTAQYDKLNAEEKESAKGKDLVNHMTELTKKIAQLKGEMDAVASDAAPQSIKKDLREMTLEIAQLTLEYQHMTEEEKNSAAGQELQDKISNLRTKAAELKDTLSDVNASIKNEASDTRGFDALSEAGKVTASVFGLCSSAAQALGVSNESLQQSMLKVQQAMQAVQALTVIQNALQKQSSLMRGIEILQTKAATAAINMKTAAEGKNVVVTKAAAAAQAVFNAIANANPYVLLAMAVVTVVGALLAFSEGSKEAADAAEEQNEKVMTLKDTYEDMSEAVSQEAGTMLAKYKMLQDGWNDLKTDMEKTEFLKQHQKDFNDLATEADYAGGEIKDVNTAENFIVRDTESVTKAILRRARAMAAYQEIIRLTQMKLRELENLSTTSYKQVSAGTNLNKLTEGEKAAAYQTGGGNGVAVNFDFSKTLTEEGARSVNRYRLNKYFEEVEKKKDEIEKRYDKMFAVAEKTLEENGGVSTAANFRGNGRGGGGGGGRSTGRGGGNSSNNAKDYKDINDEVNKYLLDALKDRTDLLEEYSDEWKDVMVEAAEKQAEVDHAANLKKKEDLEADLKKSKAAKKISEEQYNKELLGIKSAFTDKEKSIDDEKEKNIKDIQESITKHNEEEAAKRVEAIASAAAAEQAERDVSYQNSIAKLYKNYKEEVEVAQKKGKDTTKITEKFNKEKEKLDNDYADATVKATIEALEKEVKVQDLSDEERKRIRKELAEATAQLAVQQAEREKDSIDDVVQKDKEARDKRNEHIQTWLERAAEACDKISSLITGVYDGQIQKIEEALTAEQERYDAEVNHIDWLAERGAITTEEAEIRKRDAAQHTAKVQEALEKKKAAAEYKKAVAEKANSVAQIAISTAQGIMKTYAELGWPAGIPGAIFIGAMGAIQAAAALAQPIKAYAEGTKGKKHPGGLALVGDGDKAELVMYNGKAWVTPDQPTVLDLPRGAEVFPDFERKDLLTLGASLPTAVPRDRATGQPIVINDYSALESRMAANTKAVTKALREHQDALTRQLKRQKFNAYIASRI